MASPQVLEEPLLKPSQLQSTGEAVLHLCLNNLYNSAAPAAPDQNRQGLREPYQRHRTSRDNPSNIQPHSESTVALETFPFAGSAYLRIGVVHLGISEYLRGPIEFWHRCSAEVQQRSAQASKHSLPETLQTLQKRSGLASGACGWKLSS